MYGNNTVKLDALKVRSAFYGCGKTKEELMTETGYGSSSINSTMNPNMCRKVRYGFTRAAKLARALGVKLSDIMADGNTYSEPTEVEQPKLEGCAQVLQKWIDFSKIPKKRISRDTDTDVVTLRKILQGRTAHPRRETVEKLAHYFCGTLEEFMAGPPEVTQSAEEIELPYNEEPAEEQPQEETPEPVVQPVVEDNPNWLDTVLKEEIMEAHAGFKSSTKAADKKCYASIVSMHAALYTRSGSH